MNEQTDLRPTARLINDLEAICEVERARGTSGTGRLATLRRCIAELKRLGNAIDSGASTGSSDSAERTGADRWMGDRRPTSA